MHLIRRANLFLRHQGESCDWCVAYISEGLPGDPKGLKAVKAMFLDLQNSIMFVWAM